MKPKIIIPLVLLSITLLLFIAWTVPFDTRWSNSIEALAVSIALIISAGALYYAKREYEHNKKSERTALLCQYFQRYANDPYIKKIEDYILETALLDKEDRIIGYDNSKTPSYTPTVWEKEMFMHFFEEIQLLIDENMIDKDVLIALIGYYVGLFHRIEDFHSDITDYNDERYWKYYLKFVRSIPEDFYE